MEMVQTGEANPQTLARLLGELRASDKDLKEALEYINVLQKTSREGGGGVNEELAYLREKVLFSMNLRIRIETFPKAELYLTILWSRFLYAGAFYPPVCVFSLLVRISLDYGNMF